MLRLIGFLVKVTFFSVLVLILGNWLHWDGRTISDQVKIHLSHAERSPVLGEVRHWTNGLINQASQSALKDPGPKSGEILSSERQKLRVLINDLNSTRSK